MVSPVTVAHQTIKYEYPAIQMMLPRNVKMKNLRPAVTRKVHKMCHKMHFIYEEK